MAGPRLKKLVFKSNDTHRGKRLDQVLAEWLPTALGAPVSKAKVRKLIVAGAVYLNGKRVRIASKELYPGVRVEAFVDLEKLNEAGPSHDRAFEMTAERILYEDEWLIAVDKPPGLPTQPTLDEARDNLFAAVKKFMTQRQAQSGDAAGEVYLALHHRLDRDTSGVLLLVKSKDANAGVAELFSQHLAQKTYQALSHRASGAAPTEWKVRNYLARDASAGKRSRFHSVHSGGDVAETKFRLLALASRVLRIEARPLTGRTHQIRVHLSEAGLPILGDAAYGGGTKDDCPRLMLHAARLEFPHPVTKLPVRIESPVPEDFESQWRRALAGS